MNIMKRAWEIARKGAEKFGGSAKEYFAVSLKLAWKEEKEQKVVTVSVNYGWKSCYVAKIVGTHPKWKLNRQFLEADEQKRSYSGKTGHNVYYIGENGIYEKNSSGNKEYFIVENGQKREIEYREVLELLG